MRSLPPAQHWIDWRRAALRTLPVSDSRAPSEGVRCCTLSAKPGSFTGHRSDSRTSSRSGTRREAFRESSPHRHSESAFQDVHRIDLVFDTPRQEMPRTPLRSVVAADRLGFNAAGDDLAQHARALTGLKLGLKPPHFRTSHYEPREFFRITNCSMSLSRLRSATSFFSRPFSSRNCFTSCASLTSIPPYFAFQA